MKVFLLSIRFPNLGLNLNLSILTFSTPGNARDLSRAKETFHAL